MPEAMIRLPKDDIESLKQISRDAGAAILEVYETDFSVDQKDDDSPLTEADRRANAVILNGLEKLSVSYPIISEETKLLPYEDRRLWETFWLVDPLDGTKEFIKRNGEFTVNIALVHQGVPVAGFVYQPVPDVLYFAVEGEGAYRQEGAETAQPLPQRSQSYHEKSEVTVVASRSHQSPEVAAFVKELEEDGKEVTFLSAGSSLKICLVAEGKADVYPRLGPTMEWDTGAAHAIAAAAGCSINRADSGEPLVYNKEDLLNPFFIVE